MTQAAQLSDSFSVAAERAGEALVHVAASCRRGATGSVFDDTGVLVTTARAVAGRERVEISQGELMGEARVVGYDAATDIGVARVETPLGKAPRFSEGPARLGALLLAATRPGRSPRVRLGVVSRLGDAWHTLRGGRIERYVETDLAPEPGFSGGLAFGSDGLALGMLTAGLLRGVPLLLERATLERVVTALLANGRVRRGYLGVGTQAVRLPEPLATSGAQPSGLLVSSVQPESAAARAGLLLGDTLLKLGPAPLTDARALQAALEDAEGVTLPLTLLRAGLSLTVDVTPGSKP